MAGETMNPAECGLKEQKQKRYVDINPAIEFLEGYDNSWGREFADGVRTALHSIKKLPAADVQEVKYAHWANGICTNCGVKKPIVKAYRGVSDIVYQYQGELNYCPNCGAKMDEEDGK